MGIVIRKILALSFLILIFPVLHSQSINNKALIRAVQEADGYFYFDEDYDTSAKLYEAILKQYPQNCNFMAKLGISYLNVDGKKTEAMKLLEKASRNVVTSDNEYIEFGEQAPLDTWYYLAYAYHINDSLEKAVLLYTQVKKNISAKESFRLDYIDNQIAACRYAMLAEKTPAVISSGLFVPWLSEFTGANYPAISKNDSVFVFTIRKDDGNHIFCSYKNKTWQPPQDITIQLGDYPRLCSNSITGDGKILILYMDDGANGDLYSSQRTGDKWSKIRKLGKNINTKYWEAHGFITSDGNQLYFSSNRTGGFGELDIWVSQKDPSGNWGPALNLGNIINSRFNENTPFYDTDRHTLLFCSYGHTVMGSYDTFISTFKNGKWSEPIGLPYPVNTTSDNSYFLEYRSSNFYVTSMVDEKNYKRNIFLINTIDSAGGKIEAKGSFLLDDGMVIIPQLADLKIKTGDNGRSWDKLEVNDSGFYNFIAKPGQYQLKISYAGYKTDTINLNIPDNFSGKSVSLNTSLIPEKVSSGDFLAMRNILFDYNSYSLGTKSRTDLERIKTILNNHPELKIEVTGYTDILGNPEYNLELSKNRAKEVVKYLTSSGIKEERFILKAGGAKDFVALNFNPDGSDNPAGRQFNRRVTLGIINPQTGVIIETDSYTPSQLRYPYSNKYSIVLLKSAEKYYPDYFKDFNISDLLFVRPVLKDSAYLYILSDFSNRSDAEAYLAFAKEKGFADGYIINKYELNEEPRQLIDHTGTKNRSGEVTLYTIQLKASKAPINISAFSQVKGVREIKGKDGYYRYITGEFEGFSTAKTALDVVHKAGYKDAFVKDYGLLSKQ